MASRGLNDDQCGDGERAAAPNVLLFQRMPEPLRAHVRYIHAALSTYHPGPASADVDAAWAYITTELVRLQRDLWTTLKHARDEASHQSIRADNALADAKKRGLDAHLPSVEEVQAAWREDNTAAREHSSPRQVDDEDSRDELS